MTKPDQKDISKPWVVKDCDCVGTGCETCDGFGWYYHNPDTGTNLSEMMRGAFERHG